MKHTLPGLLGLLLLGKPAQAQFSYTTNAGAIAITGYSGSGGAVTIPTDITGLPVTCIRANAFSGSSLTKVRIPDTVTSIEDWAFDLCARLTSAAIPDSVTNIGGWAFASCTSLTSVTIGNSVKSIGDAAFFGCTSLTSVTIPGSVTRLGGWAFSGCAKLTSVYFKGNAPDADPSVFKSDNKATVHYVPGTTGWGASFGGLPTGLMNSPIPAAGFSYTTNASGITITGYDGPGGAVTIPTAIDSQPVTGIGTNAFSGANLISVTIPVNITSIGDGAFSRCTNLMNVTISNGVTNIGDGAFYACTSLASAYFLGNAPTVGLDVFDSDDNGTVYYVSGTTGWSSVFAGLPAVLWTR